MYLCGYSLELGLKHGICTIMKFDNGFPENKQEFNTYYLDTTKTFLRSTIRELRDIRHHRLQDLLRYSGEQVNIEKNFAEAWNVAINWTPEMRYKNDVIRRKRVERFIQSVRVILNEIM
ncbi:MAG: hypothetical protein JWQ27_755 [Ferruginibacter sp.]|nr:hypothetical protein [Ferruginibacter sp.]